MMMMMMKNKMLARTMALVMFGLGMILLAAEECCGTVMLTTLEYSVLQSWTMGWSSFFSELAHDR